MATALETVRDYTGHEYKYGFVTEIEADIVPKGLDDDIVRLISAKKNEPSWMTEWRLKALARWRTMEEPKWAKVEHPPIDFQAISYYAAPKSDAERPKSLAEVDPELLRTYEKLGIPIREQEVLAGVAVDYVFDSVSVATTFKEKLAELGVIFCSISEALRDHPELVRRYLGSVVPAGRQLLRGAQLRGVHRRLLRLRAQGRALPDGAVDLLPDQRRRDRAVRAHPDHRRRGRLRQLPRRLHGAAARREPAPRRGGRADRARRRPDQVLDRAELVSRRPRGAGRHLQLRDQARRLPRPPRQDLLDPGRDRLGDHLEVPELHPAGRRVGRRVLFGRAHQQPPAGRHRHQDGAHRQEHALADRLQGHLGRAQQQHLSRPGAGAERRGQRPQPHPVRTPC